MPTIRLPANLESVRAAREFVASAVPGPPGSELRDAATLCVTELVANVIRHTESETCELSVDWSEGSLYLAVQDDSRSPARRVCPGAEAGRGMQIVDALSADWGVTEKEGNGKVVWVRLN